MRLRRIVLASRSPRRLELLRSLHLEVDVRPSGYGEPDDASKTPAQLAVAHAVSKAEDVLAVIGVGEALVAADTVVDLDGSALNKPVDAQDAVRMLTSLSGREHLVHTGMALALPGCDLVVECSTTRVRFYPLDPAEIDEYVATGEPMDKAGAYGIQGRAASLVEGIEGDFYTVMGFALPRFVRIVRSYGFTLPIQKESGDTAG
jgi:septum formation protein